MDGSMLRAMRRVRERAERKSRRARARDDRGAVLIEAAFLLPFLFALLFGIIDFGFTFNDWISVRQGGRDGLRQMIVKTNPANPAGGAWACPEGGGGPMAGTDAQAVMCFTKMRVGLDQHKTAVKVYYDTAAGASFTAGKPVKICVQYRTASLTRAYASILDNKVLDTEVESLIETTSASMAPFQENAFPDGTALTWGATCTQL